MARKMRDIMSPAPVAWRRICCTASGQPARLAAALVRVSLSQRAASEVTASVRD